MCMGRANSLADENMDLCFVSGGLCVTGRTLKTSQKSWLMYLHVFFAHYVFTVLHKDDGSINSRLKKS